MGINEFWQEDVTLTLQNICHETFLITSQPYYLLSCGEKLILNLISLENNLLPDDLIHLQERYAFEDKHVVHLWEDVWVSKREQVLSRILSFVGLNETFHGRKGKIISLEQLQIKSFLNANHLQGYVKAKYNFGLVENERIIAVACFSESRPMPSKGEGYQSSELVRFASLKGITVVGGLSKFIKHFFKLFPINDLMTYADRDWSLGNGYKSLDFELTSILPPAYLYVNTKTLERYFPHRLPKQIISAYENQTALDLNSFLASHSYLTVFNTGNLKFHIYN